MSQIDKLIERCTSHPAAFFAGPREESVVAAAEEALGHSLPADYRTFVLRLGAGSIGSSEVYGVISEPFDGPVPDAVWATVSERSAPSNLPSGIVVIGADGMGGSYVLDTSEGGDPPVKVWNGGRSTASDELEVIATGFAAHLHTIVDFEHAGHSGTGTAARRSSTPNMGDKVRILNTVATERSGHAGLEGLCYGFTTPSVTDVAVIGDESADLAFSVSFPETELGEAWFTAECVEVIDHSPGLEITVGDKRFIRTASGGWEADRSEQPTGTSWTNRFRRLFRRT